MRFTVDAYAPYPYLLCYCSVCRKTQGGGGYAINLGAHSKSLKVEGQRHVRVFRATIKNPEDETPRQSEHQRHFCGKCGSHLWAWHPDWPDLVHPLASAIDTPLPQAPEQTHIMLEFKAPWVKVRAGRRDRKHQRYPDESLAEWHARLGIKE